MRAFNTKEEALRTRDGQVIERIDYKNREIWVQVGFNAFGIFGKRVVVRTDTLLR